MWKRFKDNWYKILLAILASLYGGEKAYEYATTPEQPPPAEYAAPASDKANTWTVTAWFTAEKQAGGGALPSFRYTDNLGRYTVEIHSRKRPTNRQIVAAFDTSLNPEAVTVDIVSLDGPPKDEFPDVPEEGPEKD